VAERVRLWPKQVRVEAEHENVLTVLVEHERLFENVK
jgi:hypothetical protein